MGWVVVALGIAGAIMVAVLGLWGLESGQRDGFYTVSSHVEKPTNMTASEYMAMLAKGYDTLSEFPEVKTGMTSAEVIESMTTPVQRDPSV